LVVGIGAGWLQAEFDAVVGPPFAARGRVTGEYLSAFHSLWTEETPNFDADWVKYDGIFFEPKPVQKPHPPIWVGGESGPSLRRAARFGDAWYPIGSNSKHLLDTLPRYRAGIARLRKLIVEAGREPASVALTYRVKRYGEDVPAKASDGERRLFSGNNADIIADLRALRDLGVAAIDIDFERSDTEDSVAEMRRFKEQVISRL
jgi:alkanesulfonate monooxygenase SsuD/methylene tetrahydromethanopterin reductase-like flavin-dependent oxidoreductase (luciferase family)